MNHMYRNQIAILNRVSDQLAGGLRDDQFDQIAPNGFGDGQNSYAHSMIWFNDRLYVGTTRNNLCLIKSNPQRNTMRQWPVHCPDDLYTGLDMRAQIWSYDPKCDHWSQVFVSPYIRGSEGRDIPRDIGYRKMFVYQGASDPAPVLYVSTMSWTEAPGSYFLRSMDGISFEPVSEAGLKDSTASSFRSLVAYKGKLYSSPGGEGTAFYKARLPIVVESADPASGIWETVSEPGFGDDSNTAIAELVVFNGFLYAGTLNPLKGFQIWKTDAEGKPPYQWTQVLGSGAYRGNLNEGVISFCVFKDALYVGGHISMGGHDRRNFVGPAPAEVIRVHADDGWDLLIGNPRQTPDGHKAPLGNMGPGFDNPFAGYIWCMQEHQGWLYAGTFDSTVFLQYADISRQPRRRQAFVERTGIDRLIEREGGFDLWRSQDGENWTLVSRNGFANPYNYGIRNLVSTPVGLFLGTANPFGPQVAIETQNGWHYVDNPHGGLEIWLASTESSSKSASELALAYKTPFESRNQSTINVVNRRYDSGMFDDPVEKYYDYSDFANWGYWTPETRTQKQACENLMEQLLAFIPRKRGKILDVACGKGATTRHLLNYFKASNITGINISEKQLERCRENAPGCTFLIMDATDLEFDDNQFDCVICVEAAFHFKTRAAFFEEALRVLKSGGYLVLSDILFTPSSEALSPTLNAENWLETPEAYADLLQTVGFTNIDVVDATEPCWLRHNDYRTQYTYHKLLEGKLSMTAFNMLMYRQLGRIYAVRYYLLAAGMKPFDE